VKLTFFLRKIKNICELIGELFSPHLSEPLKEDPNDLVNIHNPNIREYTMTYFVEGKRKTIYDWWYSTILKDEEANLYFIIFSFHPDWSHYRFTCIGKDKNYKELGVTSNSLVIGDRFNAIGYCEHDDTIELCVPKTTKPHLRRSFARCVIKAGESHITLETNKLAIKLIFSSLGMPFWINKGREAVCSPTGDKMSGFYDISDVEGTLKYNTRRSKLTGVGINEHLMSFVPPERHWKRMDGVFFCTDQIYCAFIYLENDIGIRRRVYKDGAIVIRTINEYLVPIDFKIEYLRFDQTDKIPLRIRIVANTKKGELNAVAEVIGRIEKQLALKIADAKFVFCDGRELKLTNGYGQHALH